MVCIQAWLGWAGERCRNFHCHCISGDICYEDTEALLAFLLLSFTWLSARQRPGFLWISLMLIFGLGVESPVIAIPCLRAACPPLGPWLASTLFASQFQGFLVRRCKLPFPGKLFVVINVIALQSIIRESACHLFSCLKSILGKSFGMYSE